MPGSSPGMTSSWYVSRKCTASIPRRSCESRNPYAALYRLGALSETFRPINAGGYGSLLSQGRRKRIQLSNGCPVIASASEAIHLAAYKSMDCFVAYAPRNDVDRVPHTT